MDHANFTPESPGTLVRAVQGYWAFVPDPLPPDIPLSWSLVRQLSEADRALSELSGIARNLPNPHLLINPFLRREALLSSQIEGTQTSLSELFFFEASASETPPNADVEEVVNYIAALEYGLASLETRDLSLSLLRDIHDRLLQGVRGHTKSPGKFRDQQNWIGPPGSTLEAASYVPPPPLQMRDALQEFERFVQSPSELPSLIRMALIHYQFEAIHPFEDGNGRIGRLLITLLLCKEQLLPQPLLYLSAFFEKNRSTYLNGLQAVTERGMWEGWIRFFLTGVVEQAHDAVRRSDRLLRLWQEYRGRMQSIHASSTVLQLIDELFAYPALNVARATKLLGVTPRSAQMALDKLISAEIIREATGRQRNRVFVAPHIIQILEAPDF